MLHGVIFLRTRYRAYETEWRRATMIRTRSLKCVFIFGLLSTNNAWFRKRKKNHISLGREFSSSICKYSDMWFVSENAKKGKKKVTKINENKISDQIIFLLSLGWGIGAGSSTRSFYRRAIGGNGIKTSWPRSCHGNVRRCHFRHADSRRLLGIAGEKGTKTSSKEKRKTHLQT